MAKRPIKQNYRDLYPEISPEVESFLKTSDRSIEYLEYDLKVERRIRGKDRKTIGYRPSLEDSLERLMENDKQFASAEDIAANVEKALLIKEMMHCVEKLSQAEQELITLVFFQEKTQTELQNYYHISQQGISKRLKQVLKKLAEFMKI